MCNLMSTKQKIDKEDDEWLFNESIDLTFNNMWDADVDKKLILNDKDLMPIS